MPRVELYNFHSPVASLNNTYPSFALKPNQFRVMSNIKLEGAVLAKRGGAVPVGSATSSAKVMGVWHGYRADGTETPVRLRFEGGAFQFTTGTAWSATGLSGWSTSVFPSVAFFQDDFYACNGTQTPQKFPMSDPTTFGSWGTLPTGFNPKWVVAYGNRLYAGGDISTPNRVHFSDFGDPATWQEQNFYTFPDNQQGGSAVTAMAVPTAIILQGLDFFGTLTGYSEVDHSIQAWPRRAALVSPRAFCDMGGMVVTLTPEGPELLDGYSQPRNLDPDKEIDWGDMNLTTQNDTWIMRSGPSSFKVFFRSRGQTTSSSSATVSASRLFTTIFAYARSFLSRVSAASAPANTSHYYEYDLITRSWSGPHTGPYTAGDWETAAHGDRQNPWAGHSSNGKVFKLDQDTYTDDGVTYTVRLRTGSFGLSPFRKHKVNYVEAICNAGAISQGVELNIYFDEADTPSNEKKYSRPLAVQRGDFVVLRWDLSKHNVFGFSPEIELVEDSNKPFVVRAIAAEIEEIK
jgi:hypothetical protein